MNRDKWRFFYHRVFRSRDKFQDLLNINQRKTMANPLQKQHDLSVSLQYTISATFHFRDSRSASSQENKLLAS